jgi:hypothetical protein
VNLIERRVRVLDRSRTTKVREIHILGVVHPIGPYNALGTLHIRFAVARVGFVTRFLFVLRCRLHVPCYNVGRVMR